MSTAEANRQTRKELRRMLKASDFDTTLKIFCVLANKTQMNINRKSPAITELILKSYTRCQN